MQQQWTVWMVFVVAAVAVALTARGGGGGGGHALTLARDALGNEALVVEGIVAGARALFMIDTAYAGAPVLSTSYLAVQSTCGGGAFAASSTSERYARCVRALRHEVSEPQRHAAVDALLRGGRCRAYTSGCTMRLMGIGETTEAQADMLLCPALRPQDGYASDVLVTHPLRGSVHILTCDYLLHRAPCVLRPGAGVLHVRLSLLAQLALRPTFHFVPVRFVGGAFCVVLEVGGTPLHVVVDTGAAAALSLGKGAAAKLKACTRPAPARRATQSGVHGERVCSDVLTARVRLGALDLGDVEVFANATEVEGADGYAGLGLLRALDLWLEPHTLGARRSGLAPRGSDATQPGDCGRGAPPACAA